MYLYVPLDKGSFTRNRSYHVQSFPSSSDIDHSISSTLGIFRMETQVYAFTFFCHCFFRGLLIATLFDRDINCRRAASVRSIH